MRVFALFGAVCMVAAAFVLGINYSDTPSQEAAAIRAIETTSTQTETALPEPAHATYRVLKVVDGDTLALEMDGKSVTVRLIGLDTPETLDPRKPVQCFGKEASDKAKELLAGTTVSIETDPSQGELDKYGRQLLYVYLPDGTLFNQHMIAEGYAHEYTYNLPYRYQSQFKAAEKQARETKKGLWADSVCAEESDRPSRTVLAPAQAIRVPSGDFECSKNTYNCSSFKTQAEAEAAFEACGGASNDVHKLDNDKDGVVCESLP